MGHAKQAQRGITHLKELISRQTDFSGESGIPFMLSAAKILLHIPITETERKEINEYNRNCSEGGRLLCCYLLEQSAWENGEYERIIGVVETALHMTKVSYSLITLYYYLSAPYAALRLKDVVRAEIYFQKAWKLAEADGFWAPMGETHGCLQIFLEKKIKHENPASYKQIMQITHQYRNGWRNLICKEIQSDEKSKKKAAQESLTGMEYAVAFLAGLGWINQEIGNYFFISVRTVKYYMTAVFRKLNIDSRQKISELLD